MTRPLPAPHAIDVPHRGQLPFQQFDNERAGRVGSDAKKCTRVTPIYPKGGAPKKSECTYGLRSSKTTIVPIIAASVAMTNAVLFFRLLVSPGHTMDSNTAIDSNADQSVARGHCGVFVVRDFLRKSDVLRSRAIDRLARSIGDLQDIVRAVKARGASLKATEQPIDTSTAAGKCFLDMLGVFAEFETNLRKERQLEGIAERESAWRLQGPQGKHRSGEDQADDSRGHGAVRHREGSENWPRFRLSGACKLARRSTSADWLRRPWLVAPQGILSPLPGEGKKFWFGTHYVIRRVTAPAGLWPSTAPMPLMIVGSGDALTQF